jgi:predicted DNA-binding WGR domain protein
MLTSDIYFFKLCAEIDLLKQQNSELQEKFDKVNKEYDELLKSSIDHSQVMQSQVLKLVFELNKRGGITEDMGF